MVELAVDVADDAKSLRVWRQDDLHPRQAGGNPAAAQDGLQGEDLLAQVPEKALPQEQGNEQACKVNLHHHTGYRKCPFISAIALPI